MSTRPYPLPRALRYPRRHCTPPPPIESEPAMQTPPLPDPSERCAASLDDEGVLRCTRRAGHLGNHTTATGS